MKILHLGAGTRKFPDDGNEHVTLDIVGNPDVLHDMNDLPLPFNDNEFGEIHAIHSLEHWGRQGDWEYFFTEWNEYYRILKTGGLFRSVVPYGVWTWADPGHTRVITNGTIAFLDQEQYNKQIGNTSMTDYRNIYKGNFVPEQLLMYDSEFRFVLRKV
jgi:hypothetical protein